MYVYRNESNNIIIYYTISTTLCSQTLFKIVEATTQLFLIISLRGLLLYNIRTTITCFKVLNCCEAASSSHFLSNALILSAIFNRCGCVQNAMEFQAIVETQTNVRTRNIKKNINYTSRNVMTSQMVIVIIPCVMGNYNVYSDQRGIIDHTIDYCCFFNLMQTLLQ